MTYPKVSTSDSASVPSSPRYPELEERVLEYWQEDETFRASIEQRDPGENGSNEFVFYDGPPFANGLPHYGHLLTGYVKDLIPRYQSFLGVGQYQCEQCGRPHGQACADRRGRAGNHLCGRVRSS